MAFVRISFIKVDFPLPETPEITVRTSKGTSTSMFLRLFCLAPFILMNSFGFLLVFGTSISNLPVKYFEVKVSASFNSLKFPAKTNSPPKNPASGPISIM